MFVLICFDVYDASRLGEVSRTLENYGSRVQRSVFECHLEIEALNELKRELAKIIDPYEDHIRYYTLCGKDISGILIDGAGEVTKDAGFHLI